MDKAEKQRLLSGALQWVNDIRLRYGQPAISAIPRGVPHSPGECALANALRGSLPEPYYVCSSGLGTYVDDPCMYPAKHFQVTTFTTPVVKEFLHAFDTGMFPELVEHQVLTEFGDVVYGKGSTKTKVINASFWASARAHAAVKAYLQKLGASKQVLADLPKVDTDVDSVEIELQEILHEAETEKVLTKV